MRLEQRIGRVDRLGQTQEKVTVLNLIYDDTIDKRIYERLYERLQIGKRALGGMEAILGQPIRDLTMKLLDPSLSSKQKEEFIDQTAQALENRKREEEQLEAEAGSLVQHGDYILERIMESREHHRWLSGNDILTYIRDRILRDFPGSVIETSPAGSDTYRIELSADCAVGFQDYLARRGLKGRTRLLNSSPRQRFRFTSSVVRKEGMIETISQLHPLVRFAAERDLEDDAARQAQAVAATLSLKALPADSKCAPGLYALAARRWSTGSMATFTLSNVRVGYAGACARTGKLLRPDFAERLVAAAADQGRAMLNASMHEDLDVVAATLQDLVYPELDRRFSEFIDQTTAEIKDRVTIRSKALTRHFEGKIAALNEHQMRLDAQASQAKRNGDDRRATNLKNLAKAQGARVQKMQRTWKLRMAELEGQSSTTPEESDVMGMFLRGGGLAPKGGSGRETNRNRPTPSGSKIGRCAFTANEGSTRSTARNAGGTSPSGCQSSARQRSPSLASAKGWRNQAGNATNRIRTRG